MNEGNSCSRRKNQLFEFEYPCVSGELNYFSNLTKLLQLSQDLKNLWCVNGASVQFWLPGFYQWANSSGNISKLISDCIKYVEYLKME